MKPLGWILVSLLGVGFVCLIEEAGLLEIMIGEMIGVLIIVCGLIILLRFGGK